MESIADLKIKKKTGQLRNKENPTNESEKSFVLFFYLTKEMVFYYHFLGSFWIKNLMVWGAFFTNWIMVTRLLWKSQI